MPLKASHCIIIAEWQLLNKIRRLSLSWIDGKGSQQESEESDQQNAVLHLI